VKDGIYGTPLTRLLGDFANIHPDVRFGERVKIGEFIIIEKDCVIGDDVLIGHHVVLRENTHIGHDSKIGHFASTEPGARIGNHVSIDKYCHIGRDCVVEDHVFFGFGSVPLDTRRISHGRSFGYKCDPPHIGWGARIGGNVTIMPGVDIGREALIGAGSVVTKDCEPFGIYIGVPAKKAGVVPEDERLKNG